VGATAAGTVLLHILEDATMSHLSSTKDLKREKHAHNPMNIRVPARHTNEYLSVRLQ
jgi:hypothetical protein